MAEAVVQAPLFRVGQDGIRLRAFFELLFSRFVAWISVRMVFQRELAIRALDLDLGRRTRDAQHFVVVALAHAFATFTIAGRSRRSPIM